ncbi:hypothetical protein [Bifidobacterium gallicum]|uniref:hypothetical protein n=1 Tax=Bifidobacterium gallicum TaxID=78342 RepID=UPI0002F298EA|nr:hypothetical protein [Bifidobacterium gallicum]
MERSLANDGVITKADHEQAWSDFSQCLTDKGYNPPVSVQYQGGIHGNTFMVDTGDRGDEVWNKAQSDLSHCLDLEFLNVDELYRAAIGNPQLLQDNSAALAQCLRSKNLVAPSYTSSCYREEEQSALDLYAQEITVSNNIASAWEASRKAYTFDIDAPDVQLCFITSGIDIRAQDSTKEDENIWKVFD